MERASLPALKPEEYAKRREGCADVDWRRWLGEARARYDAFMHQHSGQEVSVESKSAGKCADASEATRSADGDDERELVGALSDASASPETSAPECGSDDESRHVNERVENLAAAWDRALKRLRSRGGVLTADERREQRRLAQKEASREQTRRSRLTGVVGGGGSSEGGTGSESFSETRVLFTCDMLLRDAGIRTGQGTAHSPGWIGMTCDDPDDFQTLKERRWSTETDFKAHEPVILWRKDASAPPDDKHSYVRSGEVVKVVLAGEVVEDPEIVRYALRSHVGRQPQEQYHESRESKVVIYVRAEDSHGVPWRDLPELHLEEPAQVANAGGTSAWRVLPEPWRPVTSGKDRRYANVRHELLDPSHDGILAALEEARCKRRAGSRKSKALEESVRLLEVKAKDPPLHEELLVIPVKHVPLRVPKYDVRLKESALRAVQAQQTMLTRMVVFHCNWCTERFPAFHPAYEPPDWLPMELLKRGASGVAACNIEVATWDEVPALSPPEEDLIVAPCHTGVCRACQLDIESQRAALGEDASDAAIVPKMLFLNHTDPVFRFPHQELEDLFNQASVIEATLVA